MGKSQSKTARDRKKKSQYVVTTVATRSCPPVVSRQSGATSTPQFSAITSVATGSSPSVDTIKSVAISTPPTSATTSVATSKSPSVVTRQSVASSTRPASATSVAITSAHTVTIVATSSSPSVDTIKSVAISTPPTSATTSVATSKSPSVDTIQSVASSTLPTSATSDTTSSHPPAVTSVAISSAHTVTLVATSSSPSVVTSVATSSPPSTVTGVATSTPQPAVSNVAISSSQTTSVATSSPPSTVTSVATSTPQPAVPNVATSSSQTTSVGNDTSEPIKVTISSEETTVLQGSSLILTCTFNGESTPSAVLWTRYRESGEDIQLTPDKYSGGTVDTPSLTVGHVKAEDSGVYVCKLTFEGDQVSSNPLTINVDTTSAVLSEETNYLRIYLLCLNIGTDSVRHYFDSHVPPGSLHGHLSTHEHNLRYTHSMKCNKDQLNLLFPAIPMLPASSTFDFSLLYKLTRNTLNVPQPARGWGFPPLASDISDEDDVERIRKYRNLLAHIEHCKIEQGVFSIMWTELSQAIQRLSKGSLTTEVNALEHKRLDQDIRSKMEEDILQFRKDVKDLQQEVEDIIKSQKDQQARIESLEARPVPQHIPNNIRDGQTTQLDAWAAEDVVFYSGTAAVKEVTDKLNQHQIVTIIRGPGAGKTSIARHIALEYQRQKYEVVPICQAEDIIQFGDNSVSQVFVLDDVLGVFFF